ncbi:hypothetical protein B0H16DRAFT_1765494 [Mycena metata]|uniref:MYND-type domain-containing protein n=1 Tax=Mycena metata TaxID=1033252 RepID=A0AAD7MWE2_9AGAR|nr:hypothetical protein B0H16DRAFT_1765494 [Mycena metata]
MSQELAAVHCDGFLQTIHNKPDEVFSSYASQTAGEIQVLAQAWKEKQDGGADISSDGVLQTFLHHLDGKKVPRIVVRPPADNDPADRAWASLNGLAVGFFSEFSTQPELRTRLLSAWPDIFQWCRYFYDQRVSVEKDSTQAHNAILTICNTIRNLYTDTELQTKIRATSGIIALCTRLCLHPASPTEAFIPFSLLRIDAWGKMDEIVAAAGGKPEVVAKAILGGLRTTITQQPLEAERSFVLTCLVTSFIVFPRHPLTFAILADNGVWTALNFLRAAMIQSDSPRLVAQALDAGLLRTICALSPVFDIDTEERKSTPLRSILRDVLPKSLMYHSVLKVMKREHEELDSAFADETIMPSSLREDWMSLTLLLYMRGNIAKLPKALKGRGAVSCESTACDQQGRKSGFLRCGGCLCVYYCGKECQTTAWSSHRTMCKLKKSSQITGGQLMFSPENAQFIREIIIADAHLHNPHLRKLATRKFPKEPGENMITCIDYTNPKYPAGTCSLKNINTYIFPPVSSEAADPANVKAQNDEMLKMVCRNPSLYTFIEGTFMYGEQRLTRNVVLSSNMWITPPSQDLHSGLNWQNNKCENQDKSAVPLLDLFLGLNMKYADS